MRSIRRRYGSPLLWIEALWALNINSVMSCQRGLPSWASKFRTHRGRCIKFLSKTSALRSIHIDYIGLWWRGCWHDTGRWIFDLWIRNIIFTIFSGCTSLWRQICCFFTTTSNLINFRMSCSFINFI